MLAQFFAEQSDQSQSPLTVKLRKTLDAHFDDSLPLPDLLFQLHSECLIVQEAMEDPPGGKAGEHYMKALGLYLEALFMVGRELEANGELSEETEKAACALTGEADRAFNDFEFEASQMEEAETEG
ncbi:MAG: hypothetical protein U0931_34615 [Vulcanimicrobiota bacterium]